MNQHFFRCYSVTIKKLNCKISGCFIVDREVPHFSQKDQLLHTQKRGLTASIKLIFKGYFGNMVIKPCAKFKENLRNFFEGVKFKFLSMI